MKTFNFFLIFSLLFVSGTALIAQDMNIHKMIGKKQNEVIQKYGQPKHKDESTPTMICLFYKTENQNMIFVSDENGVYQAELTKVYDLQEGSRKDLDELIKTYVADQFKVDTVSVNDFKIFKEGVSSTIQVSENKITNKYEVRVKANKHS